MPRSLSPLLTSTLALLSGLCWTAPGLAAPPDGSRPCLGFVADALPLDVGTEARIRKGPVVAVKGDRFGVAWIDGRNELPELRFAVFDLEGNRIGDELRIDTADEAPGLEPAGDGFAVAWVPALSPLGEVRLAVLSADGTPVGPTTVVDRTTEQDHFASLAASGDGLGIAWRAQQPDGVNHDVRFARLGVDGTAIGSGTVVSDRPEFEDRPRIAGNGREYGVAWIDRWKRVLFARLTAEGERIGEIREITGEAGSVLHCDIAWGGDEWGLVANPDGRLVFLRVSASGDPVGAPVDLGAAHGFPSLAWNGRFWGVATDLSFVAFSRSGQRFGPGPIPLPGRGVDAQGARRVVPLPGGFAVATAPASGAPLALVRFGCDE